MNPSVSCLSCLLSPSGKYRCGLTPHLVLVHVPHSNTSQARANRNEVGSFRHDKVSAWSKGSRARSVIVNTQGDVIGKGSWARSVIVNPQGDVIGLVKTLQAPSDYRCRIADARSIPQ